jgi:hypothetical protein
MPTDVRFEPLEGADATAVEKLSRAIDHFRLVDPKMPTSYVSAFLSVAMRPGEGPTEYARMMGTIQPIVSRILLEIGPKARRGNGPGLGLVDRVVHESSLRNQRYFLTAKGRHLLSNVLRTMHL